MRRLFKMAVVVCGAMGVAGMLMTDIAFTLRVDTINTSLLLIAFALPVVLGVIGIVKPPMESWQLSVSLGGFVLVVIKLRIWQSLPHLTEVKAGFQLMLLGGLLGTIVTVLALAKPETPA